MANPYAKYNLGEADIPGAKAWEWWARSNGLSRARVEDGLRWYGRHQNEIAGWSSDQIVESFVAATDHVWSEQEHRIAAGFHDKAITGSYQDFQPSPDHAQARLAELEAMIGDTSSPYWDSAEAADLQKEHLALLEQANEPPKQNIQSSFTDAQRQFVEDGYKDPESPYYQSGGSQTLQRFHRQMIDESLGNTPEPGPTVGDAGETQQREVTDGYQE